MVFVKTKRNRNKFRYNFRVFLFWYPVSHSSTRVYDCCLVLVVESTRYDHRQTGETYFEVTVRLRVIASFQIKDGLLFWDEGQTRLHFPRVLGTIFHLYR